MNLADPKHIVSVIIPVFNDAHGISACVNALLEQNYPRNLLDVIVVDNGSTPPITIDGRAALIARLVRCDDPGAYAARNAGVRAARGNMLAFTDADCVPDPGWISAGVRALVDVGPSGLIGGAVAMLPPTKRNGIGLYQYEVGFQQRENIEHKGFGATANLFCWREQFDTVGMFEQSLYSCADREWAWRASRHGITISYADQARVATLPRATLGGAIRQARRVAAGRRQLAARGLSWAGPLALAPHRGGIAALTWIAGRNQLSWWERLRISAAAVAIRAATAFENLRLGLGGHAERR